MYSYDEVGEIDDEMIDYLLDDGWGHEIPPCSTPPEFDTREEALDRL